MLTTMEIGFDEALEKTLGKSNLGPLERIKARRHARRHRRVIFSNAILDFRKTMTGDDVPPAPTPDDDDDTFWERIADIWAKIVESGKIQAFFKFVIDEVLPAIIKFIAALIPILAAI